jgi:2-methylcitrate dehydratase PrpD
MKAEQETRNRTERLAEAAARFSADTLPPDTLELAKDCLLDHIAVSLYGMEQPWSRFVAEMVASDGGAAQASVYGKRLRVPAQAAALVNGTAAHGFELDDYHKGSLSHLGAAVIPAVLAVSEREHLSGRDALGAIVAGYEVMARAGNATIPSLILRGFHPTGTHGPIGAAAGVANLLRVSAPVMAAAIGIGVACAAGSMEFSQDEQGGGMSKRLQCGRAAQAGIVAVDLAKRGLTTPRSSLEGKYGYINLYSDEPNADAIDRSLGDDFEIRYNNFKRYACCGVLHASIDAITDLVGKHRFSPADVSEVIVGGNSKLVAQHRSVAPESVMAAQYSMPFSAAVALQGRAMDPAAYYEGSYRDPAALAVARLVRLELDPEIDRIFPDRLGGSVRIRLKSGQELASTVLDARGTSSNPLNREGIIEKARTLCFGILNDQAVDQLIDVILRFERLSDVSDLLRILDAGTIDTTKAH